MVADFLRSCTNVRSLSVAEKSEYWTRALAMQLEKLEVASSSTAAVLIEPGSSLCELSFDCGYSPFNARGVGWGGIGTNLESLRISSVSCSKDELAIIRKHCKILKHTDLRSDAFSAQES